MSTIIDLTSIYIPTNVAPNFSNGMEPNQLVLKKFSNQKRLLSSPYF